MNDYNHAELTDFASFLADYEGMLEEYGEGLQYTIRDTGSGDYVGGFVEASNRKVLLEDCPSIVGEVYGDYGYAVATIDPESFSTWDGAELDTLCGHLDELRRYPVLCEELWSELEEEARSTAWEEETLYVLRAIATRADDAVDRGYTLDAERLLSDWMDGAGCGWYEDIITVEGVSAYVDTDALVDIIMDEYGDILEGYVIPEPWNDPTKPEYHKSGSVGKRASLHNARTQADRHREMGLLSGEDNE